MSALLNVGPAVSANDFRYLLLRNIKPLGYFTLTDFPCQKPNLLNRDRIQFANFSGGVGIVGIRAWNDMVRIYTGAVRAGWTAVVQHHSSRDWTLHRFVHGPVGDSGLTSRQSTVSVMVPLTIPNPASGFRVNVVPGLQRFSPGSRLVSPDVAHGLARHVPPLRIAVSRNRGFLSATTHAQTGRVGPDGIFWVRHVLTSYTGRGMRRAGGVSRTARSFPVVSIVDSASNVFGAYCMKQE